MSKFFEIDVDVKDFNLARGQKVGGVPVHSYVSPSDVPSSVKVHALGRENHIYFVYTSAEPLTLERDFGEIKLYTGKNSGRLCRIDVSSGSGGVAGFGKPRLDAVTKALGTLTPRSDRQADNFSVARQILERNEHELEEAAQA